MKKVILALVLSIITVSAHALPPIPQNYYNAYQSGYDKGKSDAYHNVGRTLVITGIVVIAGVMIYELGRESRWTATENGITYRF